MWTMKFSSIHVSVKELLYQLAQTVTNRRLSTYENVLTIPGTDSDGCSYTCTVTNALGNDSQTYCKFTGSYSWEFPP